MQGIVVYAAAATEPLVVGDLMIPCRLDSSNQEPAPSAVTAALASPAAPGNVDNGAHRYLATFVTADGETQAGVISSAITVVDKTVNGQVSLTAIPLGGMLVTARKLYRTVAGGTHYLLLATLSNNTATTYTDNIADASLGAEAPTANTTVDAQLNMLIASARAHAEIELRRYLVTQTLDAYLDDFPRYCNDRFPDPAIRLPPMQSVTGITYVDNDGNTQTLATDQYIVDTASKPARIAPAYGVIWPSVRVQANAVKIRFVAGYGAAAAVPACIKQWMIMRIKTLLENPAAIVLGVNGMAELPAHFVDSLLDSERVRGRL